jgi:hypothetical protein
MTRTLGRRLARLEVGRPRPSPFDAMDPVLAGLSTSELIDLVRHIGAVRERRGSTANQQAVYGRVRDRLALVGVALP